MSKHFLLAPPDLFQRIEAAVLRNPSRLSQHYYHELDGEEVIADALDMIDERCAHCLFGWIVVETEWGVEMDCDGEDPMELAKLILKNSGRPPLPHDLAFADEATALKIIRGRAAEERAAERQHAFGPS